VNKASPESTHQLPPNGEQDLVDLNQTVARFKAGAIDAAQFRAFHVSMGIYEQRQSNLFMLRVRLPGGMILPDQMRTVAAVARQFGNGVPHMTTRQDIQIHGVPLDNMYPALCALHESQLSTKGGGGNTVRNITACYDAGVCVREAFDVTSYPVAVTEFLLSDPVSFELPRKYKIAFSGCSMDCAAATVSDAGFIAKHQDGQEGFAVYVGGGLGAERTFGWVPAAAEKLGVDGQITRSTTFWVGAARTFPGFGKEFIPSLDEGSFCICRPPWFMPRSVRRWTYFPNRTWHFARSLRSTRLSLLIPRCFRKWSGIYHPSWANFCLDWTVVTAGRPCR